MRKRTNTVVYGELYCTVCNQRMVIPRRSPRSQGHIKTMWCGRCGAERDFIEQIRPMTPSGCVTEQNGETV